MGEFGKQAHDAWLGVLDILEPLTKHGTPWRF